MTILEIITPENPILRRKAKKVEQVTPAMQTLIDDMIATMREAPGVGLAAPQVARSVRLFVAEYAEEPSEDGKSGSATPAEGDAPPPKPKLYVFINPEIVRASEEKAEGAEGCLSIPGYAGTVERHEAVTVKGLNRRGQPVKVKAKGWLARIFQHEIDHLDGVLFIDRASRVWKVEDEPDTARPEAEMLA